MVLQMKLYVKALGHKGQRCRAKTLRSWHRCTRVYRNSCSSHPHWNNFLHSGKCLAEDIHLHLWCSSSQSNQSHRCSCKYLQCSHTDHFGRGYTLHSGQCQHRRDQCRSHYSCRYSHPLCLCRYLHACKAERHRNQCLHCRWALSTQGYSCMRMFQRRQSQH